MSTANGPRVSEVTPDAAWSILKEDKSARLIDVRTRAEWGFVGVPDLQELEASPIFVEWASYPDMSLNAHFAVQVEDAIGEGNPGPLLFICRSGARSLNAAYAVADHYASRGVSVDCINVAEGFEGDLDRQGHRASQNGWKVRGLAWRQS